ncbi:MAG: tRNA pseudouridine(55) synthase TruB, partial [Actinomycetota bacterium]
VLVGKATRLFDLLVPLEKEYSVIVQFGATSTTGDVDGEIKPSGGSIDKAGLAAALPQFQGLITQQVPAYSAVKKDGEPLYRKARRGEIIELPTREVEVSSLALAAFDRERQQAVFEVTCSKGTYIRKLCEDIGSALGTGAYAEALRRTAIGEHHAGNASSLENLAALPRQSLLAEDNPSFLSCLAALYFLPMREVGKRQLEAVVSGRPIAGDATGPLRLAAGGRLVAVYGPGESGQIRPLVVLI